jgi:hypothetical protein
VNLIDPSGLGVEAGGGQWSCTVTWSAMRQPDGKITDFRMSMSCQSWGGGGTLGGGGRQTSGREMAKFDLAKLKECVKAYGFDPNSVEFMPSQPGKGGTFLGFAPWDSQRISGLGVVNDLSYNSVQIGHMGRGAPDSGIAINGPGGRPDGRRGDAENKIKTGSGLRFCDSGLSILTISSC